MIITVNRPVQPGENRLDDVILGLHILRKYTRDKFSVCAEHDKIFAGHDVEEADVSSEDKAALEEAGWNKVSEGWRVFV